MTHHGITRCLLGMVIPLMAIVSLGQASQPSPASEYYLKAKYIGTLANYITWPQGSRMADKGIPFVIAIFGESPFGSYPWEIYRDARVQGKTVKVIYPERLSDLEDCDAVFLCYSEVDRWPVIREKLTGKPILMVADSPNMANKGVMINFFFKNDRVSFEVNRKALKEHQLEISSHVLKIATIID